MPLFSCSRLEPPFLVLDSAQSGCAVRFESNIELNGLSFIATQSYTVQNAPLLLNFCNACARFIFISALVLSTWCHVEHAGLCSFRVLASGHTVQSIPPCECFRASLPLLDFGSMGFSLFLHGTACRPLSCWMILIPPCQNYVHRHRHCAVGERSYEYGLNILVALLRTSGNPASDRH